MCFCIRKKEKIRFRHIKLQELNEQLNCTRQHFLAYLEDELHFAFMKF